MGKFVAEVDEIIRNVDARLTAVMRQSFQDVIDDAQTPVSKGGRMRVDTGFLRASGRVGFGGMPGGPSRGEKSGRYGYDESSVELALAQAEPGVTLFFGWSAAYAAPREAKDGFLAGAVARWQEFVSKNVERVKAQIK